MHIVTDIYYYFLNGPREIEERERGHSLELLDQCLEVELLSSQVQESLVTCRKGHKGY